MNRNDILHALEELGKELQKKNLQGEVLIVGGAAMCLAHDARDTTKDVGALFEPKIEMMDAIRNVAKNNALYDDWLNDSVKGFIYTKPEKVPFIEYPGLHVLTVSPEYLLAMKLFSSRASMYDTDRDDIKTLINILHITSLEEAYIILEKYYPLNKIAPRTQYLLEEIICSTGDK
jgi:hypothetical protein